MLGGRSRALIIREIREPSNYAALWRMARLYPRFVGNLRRYFLGGGSYPYRCRVRTPMGEVAPTLYSHHDLWTVNEIFCRGDYPADRELDVVVDVGSNIGISALYWLTRNATSRCYLFEPDPRNVERLRANLRGHESRYELAPVAVGLVDGPVEFGIEPTGRYGAVGALRERGITVECRSINAILRSVLETESRIGILKLDTEGLELQTATAIEPPLLDLIDAIYLELDRPEVVHPDHYRSEFANQTLRLRRREPRASSP